jgi:hypothetical protein
MQRSRQGKGRKVKGETEKGETEKGETGKGETGKEEKKKLNLKHRQNNFFCWPFLFFKKRMTKNQIETKRKLHACPKY